MLEKISPNMMLIVSTVFAIGMGILVTTVRAKSAKATSKCQKNIIATIIHVNRCINVRVSFFPCYIDVNLSKQLV